MKICDGGWIGMAGSDEYPARPVPCRRQRGHKGAHGPNRGWIWVDNVDVAEAVIETVLGAQHPPWATDKQRYWEHDQ